MTCSDYTPVTSITETGNVTWITGSYVVITDVTINGRIKINDEVNLILCDGAKLTAAKGITVSESKTLNIYAQSDGASKGELVAKVDGSGTTNDAAIGGENDSSNNCGTITIHGGKITATTGLTSAVTNGAGIGGGKSGDGGNIKIFRGTVTSTATAASENKNAYSYGAGIGGGYGGSGGNIEIYDGAVTSTATATSENGNANSYGAGIGGGNAATFADITIRGGTVEAKSGAASTASVRGGYGCGIGNGKGANGDFGDITITGGTVTATGGDAMYSGDDGSQRHGICGRIVTMSMTTTVEAKGGNGIDSLFGGMLGGHGICGEVQITAGSPTVMATGGNGVGLVDSSDESSGNQPGGNGIKGSVTVNSDVTGSAKIIAIAGVDKGNQPNAAIHGIVNPGSLKIYKGTSATGSWSLIGDGGFVEGREKIDERFVKIGNEDTVPSVAAPSAAPTGKPTVETKTDEDGTKTETKTTTYTDGSTMTEEKTTQQNGTVTEKTEVVSPDGSKSYEVTVETDGTKTEKVETVSADGSETTSKEVVTEPDGAKTITESTEKTDGLVKSTEEIKQTVDADGNVTGTVKKTTEENTETGKKTERETVWDETGGVATTKTVETQTKPSGDYSKVTMNTTYKKDKDGNITGASVTLDTEQKTGNTTQKSSFILLDTGSNAKKASLNSLIRKAAKSKNAVALKKATTTKKNGTITIEKTVKADGKTYTVTMLKKGLLKKNKTKPKKVTIKASGITKVEKGAFNKLARKATIKIKAGKKDFNRIKKLITKSGLPKGVKIKRIK